MGSICRAQFSADRVPSRSFVRSPQRLKMHARVPRASKFQTSVAQSRPHCRSTPPRYGHLTATTPTRQRRLDFATLYVANCEPPLSVHVPDEQQKEPAEVETPPIKSAEPNRLPAPREETTAVGDRVESAFSRSWTTAGVVALTLVILFLSYEALVSLTETQLQMLCVAPFVWDWGNRIADLRKRHKIWRILGLATRLAVAGFIAIMSPYTGRSFIFQLHRNTFPICCGVTALTVGAHWLLQSRNRDPPAELEKPDFEFLSPFFTDDVAAFGKTERRLSMGWIYFIGVLALPLLHETLYRGIIVVSQGYFFAALLAALMGALAFNMSQPFRTPRHFLAVLAPGVLWGLLTLWADRNLMYPLVAHMIHNAVLFSLHHYQSLIECF